MSPAAPRRPSRSTLLIVGVLVIGIAGIVYSRVRQARMPAPWPQPAWRVRTPPS